MAKQKYNGPERRQPPYCEFSALYDERFNNIDKTQEAMKQQIEKLDGKVDPLHAKITNGLSDLPDEVRNLRRLLWGLLVAIVLATIGIPATAAVLYTKLDAKVDHYIEAKP